MYDSNFYSYGFGLEDLPHQVIASGLILNRFGGADNPGYIDVNFRNVLYWQGDQWLVTGEITGDFIYQSHCLFSTYSPVESNGPFPGILVKDNFADSYTIQGFPWSGPFIVERTSDCRWQTTVDGTLYFGNPDNPPATGKWTAIIELHQYYFEIVIVWTNNDPNDFYHPNQLWRYSKLGAPTEPNSSPSGNYSGGEFGEISVS